MLMVLLGAGTPTALWAQDMPLGGLHRVADLDGIATLVVRLATRSGSQVLGVIPMDVVGNGRGAEAAERGMRAAVMVELDEGRQGGQASRVGGIRPGIRPTPGRGCR